ncbi:MAG: DUF2207 domain-containing protein [Mogibacterium sp.]|nr:DUF2207 domain-containing protein [Mogibacterium sp.]
MKKIRIKITTILMIFLVIAVSASAVTYTVLAEGDNSTTVAGTPQGVAGGAFEVTNYTKDVTVGKDHSFDVEETISVSIPDDLQRIDFAIPSGTFRIRGVEVENAASEVRIASSGSTVSIVGPDDLTKGYHEYKIRYKILEFADRDPEHDILYFSILLNEWMQPIADFTATMHFPEDFPLDSLQYYAGQFGVQDEENRIEYTTSKKNSTLTIRGQKIPENYGITLKADLNDGYWQGALDGIWAVLTMLLVMGLVALILLIMWLIGGRDPKIKKTLETRPIEGVSPVEVGYVFNSKMDIRDLIRLILYFGTKGYLRISEYEPKRYRLYRVKDPDGEEKLMRNAYNILFEDVYQGRALEMDSIGERLVRIESTIKDDVAAGFTDKEMMAYKPLSKIFRIAGIVLLGFGAAITNALGYHYQYISVNYLESIVIGVLIAGLTAALCALDDRQYSSNARQGKTGEIICCVLIGAVSVYLAAGIIRQTGKVMVAVAIIALIALSVFLAVIMRARGKGNAALVMRFRQLRRFINHPTPKELLENYLADSNYYYDMMLYALTFGSEEAWAISFLTLDVPEPEWYTDDIEGHAFTNLRGELTTIDYARDLKSFVRTIDSAYDDMQRRSHRR